jgi:hypothetical protein
MMKQCSKLPLIDRVRNSQRKEEADWDWILGISNIY